jgi:tRNA(Arg) A34 adenosine deaminase TadA
MNERIVQMLTRLAIDNPGVQNRCKLAAGPMMMPEYGYREGQMYLHAEPDAIKNALRLVSQDQLARCDLYVIRVKRPYTGAKTWIQGIAKPCAGCMKTITLYGIKNVYWTTDEDDTYRTQEQGH